MYINQMLASLKNTTKRIIGTTAIGLGVAILAGGTYLCFYKISPGYAGVIYNWNGGVEDSVLDQGVSLVLPWETVVSYPVSTETVYYRKSNDESGIDSSINVSTSDGKTVLCEVTYSFHFEHDRLPEIFTKFRGQPILTIEQGYMKNEMFQAINEVTSQYSLMELVGNKRPEINAKILDKFRESLVQFGIIIETFNLSNVTPDAQTSEAIQAVVNASNILEKSKIEKETAEIEAEKARISAKGKADALRIEAEGQAEANTKLQSSLNNEIVKKQWIEKWDGKLPTVSSNNDNLLIDVK